VLRLVRAFAATVDTDGKFYRDNRFPAYIYDKLAGGLIDAGRYAGDNSAIATLRRATQAAIPYMPPHAMRRNENAHDDEDFRRDPWDESHVARKSIPCRATDRQGFTELARRFLYDDFFWPGRRRNALPVAHAYSQSTRSFQRPRLTWRSANTPISMRRTKASISSTRKVSQPAAGGRMNTS
jgi:hypothetical protein